MLVKEVLEHTQTRIMSLHEPLFKKMKDLLLFSCSNKRKDAVLPFHVKYYQKFNDTGEKRSFHSLCHLNASFKVERFSCMLFNA